MGAPYPVTLDDGDYWRDGVMMYLVDECPESALSFAVMQAEDGEEFNAAIWAAIRLRDLVCGTYQE